jgi:hypothetical protein
MCLRRAPEKYIAGAALDRAGLDNRLTDGGKVVSPTHRTRFVSQKHFSASCIHFCSRLSEPQGLVRPEGLGKLKTINSPHGVRTRDLLACSIVP